MGRLLKAQPELARLIGEALAEHPESCGAPNLHRVLLDESAEPAARLRVAAALVKLAPGSAESMRGLATPLAEALIAEQPHVLSRWIELLGPVSASLEPPLEQICCDLGRDATDQSTAAEALAVILARDSSRRALAQLTADATPEASRVVLGELVRLGPTPAALEALRRVLDERVADPDDEAGKDALAGRHASAGIALAALGEPESLWRLLRHRSDPRLRALLIERLAAGALNTRFLVDRLSQPRVEPVELQAILLAWAEMHRAGLTENVKATVLERARILYREDPDPGVHSAAELLLLHGGAGDEKAFARRAAKLCFKQSRPPLDLGPERAYVRRSDWPARVPDGFAAGQGRILRLAQPSLSQDRSIDCRRDHGSHAQAVPAVQA